LPDYLPSEHAHVRLHSVVLATNPPLGVLTPQFNQLFANQVNCYDLWSHSESLFQRISSKKWLGI